MMKRFGVYLKTGTFRYPALAAVAMVFLFTGLLMASSMRLTGNSQAAPALAAALPGVPPSFADLAERLGPAVVNIKVTKIEKAQAPDMPGFGEGPFGDMFRHFFGDQGRGPGAYRTQGAGSGVIINADGTVLTNNHVVENAKEITVTLSDKREFKARTIGRDPKTDLAVLKLEGRGGFTPAALGDSETLRVGEWVLAIGNPFGLSNTVTSGIVSAKGRVIGQGPYDDFIQTDAPINPGNSGGPLFNMKGEVVGINTAIIPNGQGIGFAVPVNTAKALLPQLVSKGQVTRGYLGVSVQDVTDDLARSMKLAARKGALISDVVPGSPAEKGGLKQGDVIIAFNGKEIIKSQDLAGSVAATPVDKEVPVRISRDGKDLSLTIKTGTLPSGDVANLTDKESSNTKWGLALRDLDPATARRSGIKAGQGVAVVGVEPGSPADQASLREGDIIREINRVQVRTVAELKKEIEKTTPSTPALLLVERSGGSLYIVLKG